jgi:hypothetical protein
MLQGRNEIIYVVLFNNFIPCRCNICSYIRILGLRHSGMLRCVTSQKREGLKYTQQRKPKITHHILFKNFP